MLADSVSGEGLFIDDCLLTVCSHMGEGEGALWGLFYRDTNPIPEDFALMA